MKKPTTIDDYFSLEYDEYLEEHFSMPDFLKEALDKRYSMPRFLCQVLSSPKPELNK